MLPEIGETIPGVPRQLHFERHLEYLEGPILSQYRAEEGGVAYLEKWCTRTEDGAEHRFLLVRSDLRSIAQYMAHRLTMRDLLEGGSDGIGFLIDRSRNGTRIIEHRVALLVLDELPEDYMPEEDTYHDES